MQSQRRNLLRDVTWLLATLFAIGSKGVRKLAFVAPSAAPRELLQQPRARILPPTQSVMRRG